MCLPDMDTVCLSLYARAQVEVFDESSPNLTVAVRVRQILKSGVRASEAHQKDIMRVMNDNVVVVLDPDDEKVGDTVCQNREPRAAGSFCALHCS